MTLDQLLSKAFNGKAENIVISKNIIMFHLDGVETRINLVSFIDQIYNDHEAELEALQQHKSCDNCEYESGDNFKTLIECGTDIHICALCKRGTNDYFKPKEQWDDKGRSKIKSINTHTIIWC